MGPKSAESELSCSRHLTCLRHIHFQGEENGKLALKGSAWASIGRVLQLYGKHVGLAGEI